MKSVAVFCGSSSGTNGLYVQAAANMGQLIASQGLKLVYGGGKVGLMGVVADAVLNAGGEVIGVIPQALCERELAHKGLTELYIVNDMHERKVKMAELADSFVALPGGAGTFEEILEQWTWGQLGIHKKPCAFLNINDYYKSLAEMFKLSVSEGFTKQNHADMLIIEQDPEVLFEKIFAYQPPMPKWQTV